MTKNGALEGMHQLLLEALRHREQEIMRYLAILAPALGGFFWLWINSYTIDPAAFTAGTIGVLFVLLLGALYAAALGYNYRYIVLQLAKLEMKLGISNSMLVGWPRTPSEFEGRYRWFCIPWCTPPEIIKVFWTAFLVATGLVMGSTLIYVPATTGTTMIESIGSCCLVLGGVAAPVLYGRKLQSQIVAEGHSWDS